jgi:choline transporter-like protein 2/4/5
MPCCRGKAIQPDGPKVLFVPYNKRSCRDVIFLLLWMAFLAGNFFVAYIGFQHGEPQKLIYASDYNGGTCGLGPLADKKYVYYPRMNEDMLQQIVKEKKQPHEVKFYGLCQESCPVKKESGKYVCNYEEQAIMDNKTSAADKAAYAQPLVAEEKCWYMPLDTLSTFFRCFPSEEVNTTVVIKCLDSDEIEIPADSLQGREVYTDGVPNENCKTTFTVTQTMEVGAGGMSAENPMMDKLMAIGPMIGRWTSDLQLAAPSIFVIGVGFAFTLGVFWLVLIKYCAGPTVWLTVTSVILVVAAGTLLAGCKGGLLGPGCPALMNLALSGDLAVSDLVGGGGGSGGGNSTGGGGSNSTGGGGGGQVSTQTSGTSDAATEQALAEQQRFQGVAYVGTAVTLLLLCVLIFMRKQIKVAIAMMKEASRAAKVGWLIGGWVGG